MAREKKQSEPEEAVGAPEWMVTFSDCMTLLLTFFVLLLSFSSFDDKIFRRLQTIYSDALCSVGLGRRAGRDSLRPLNQIEPTVDVDNGSEKPTLETGQQGSMKKTKPVDFRNQKVFLSPSKRFFWGKGVVITSEGRDTLTDMAAFLRKVPGRVVISENGPNSDNGKNLGLLRAWTVVEYLTTQQGLDKKRFSISETSTLEQAWDQDSRLSQTRTKAERTLEIVLLERSIQI